MLKGRPTPSHENRISAPHEVRSSPSYDARASTENRGTFLRFITADGREFGFPFSQLLQFILDSNPDPIAPQRLLLAFSSHDVTVTGSRLDLLCEQLDGHNAIRLSAEDPRFASIHPAETFVAGISISSLSSAYSGSRTSLE